MDFRIETKEDGEKVAILNAEQVIIPEKEIDRNSILRELRTAKLIRDTSQRIVDTQNEKIERFTAIINRVDPTVEVKPNGEIIEAATVDNIVGPLGVDEVQ